MELMTVTLTGRFHLLEEDTPTKEQLTELSHKILKLIGTYPKCRGIDVTLKAGGVEAGMTRLYN